MDYINNNIVNWVENNWGRPSFSLDELTIQLCKNIYPSKSNWQICKIFDETKQHLIDNIEKLNSNFRDKGSSIEILLFNSDYTRVFRHDSKYWNNMQPIFNNKSSRIKNIFKIIKYIQNLDYKNFEILCALIFKKNNYNMQVSGKPGDGGLDFQGYIDNNCDYPNINNKRYIFGQCKRYSNSCTVLTSEIESWLYKIDEFKNHEGNAYKIWNYKENINSIKNTDYYFCCSSNIQKSGIEKLKKHNVNILYVEFIALFLIYHFDNIFDKNGVFISEKFESILCLK